MALNNWLWIWKGEQMTNWFIADCCKTCERFDIEKNRKRNEARCAFECKKPKEFGEEYAKHIVTFKGHDRNGRYFEEAVEAKGEDMDGLDLKPCPLCGGKATLRCITKGHTDDSVFREFEIVCDECGLATRSARMTATVTPYGTFKLNDDEMMKLLSQWDWRKDERI